MSRGLIGGRRFRGVRGRASRLNDEGFSLVEIMVAMILLGIIFVALAPILIGAVKVTTKNTAIAAATQLANERLETARKVSVTGSCQVMRDTVQPAETVTTTRGVPLTVSGTVSNCTQDAGMEKTEPRLALVTVTVATTESGYGSPVATTTSQVYVKFQS